MPKEPLMEGLAGQYKPRQHKYGYRKKTEIDPLDEHRYRVQRINFDVPIRSDKVMNANIKAHLLDDKSMRELGFEEKPFHWELKEKVSFLPDMEEYLIVTIGKEKQGINIKVFDEYLDDIYDYQAQLQDDEFNRYANAIHINVQKVMMRLVEAGVVSGYKENDYI